MGMYVCTKCEGGEYPSVTCKQILAQVLITFKREPYTSEHVPYSGKVSLVQNFAEMRPVSSEEFFVERIHDALTTPLQVGGQPHPTCKPKK